MPGEAISNLVKLASLPRPAGFFDPANPADLPPPKARKAVAQGRRAAPGRSPPPTASNSSERSPLLSFAQTDMAFAGDRLFVGNYHGFNIYRLDAAGLPSHISSVVCPGGQGDVSVVGNLLLMSVEQGRGRTDCGLQGVNAGRQPRALPRAAHLRHQRHHAPAPGRAGPDLPRHRTPIRWSRAPRATAASWSIIRAPRACARARNWPAASAMSPGDDRTALFRIDIIEIPVANPAAARIIASPGVFADEAGRLAGLAKGGKLVDDGQETSVTDQCHDITVFPTRKLAAGACSGNGIIFDIADPRKPRRIDVVSDPGFAYWHSATFNNDGTKVLFTDEWGGGGRPRCRSFDPRNWGADAIYDIDGGKLMRKGTYKLPAPQTEQENCVAHNGSIVPVPGRDIMVQAWYQGGMSMFDYTDSARAVRDRLVRPRPDRRQAPGRRGGYWSTYYYRGRIYGTEIARGLDVFALKPSANLSANEIAAAALADQGGRFNPQQQYPVALAGRAGRRARLHGPACAAAACSTPRSTSGSARRLPRRRSRSTPAPSPTRWRATCARSPDEVTRNTTDAKRRAALSDVLKAMAERLD